MSATTQEWNASAVTADIISVDRLFKRSHGVLYSQWRTALLKQKLAQHPPEHTDRRTDYSAWRAQLLTSNQRIIRRQGKRSYLLEARKRQKSPHAQGVVDEHLMSFVDTPPITPQRSPRSSVDGSDGEDEEEEDSTESVMSVISEGDSVTDATAPTDQPSRPKPRSEADRKRDRRRAAKEKRKQRAEKTEQLPGGGRVSDAYAFTGMHHIWDEHAEAVTRIIFANYDNGLLAFGSFDGDIHICYALPEPKVHVRIQGHSQCVTDLAFSSTNDWLMSSSVDHTLRVWKVEDGQCIRKITGTTEFVCCAFHPLNSNLLFAGTIKGHLVVYNLSTGQISQQLDCSAAVNTLTWDPQGRQLFVGDAKGFIYIFEYDLTSGKITKTMRTSVLSRLARARPIVSIQYKAWSNSPQHRPELLVSCQDNTLKLYNVVSSQSVTFKKEFKDIPNSSYRIRSCFCPLISLRDGACVVTGGEDMTIRIFDVLRTEKPCVNELMGHSGPVLDVCWNHEESLMGSCDATGTVILWKRVKFAQTQ